MSRKDRTFTATDVIRLFCFNLDRNEMRNVIIFFIFVVPLTLTADSILELFKLARIPQKIAILILRFIIAIKKFFGIDFINLFKLILPGIDVGFLISCVLRILKVFPR